MRNLIAAAVLTAGTISVAACGSPSSVPAPAPPSPSAAVTLGPRKLASFPSTAGGRAARGTCEAWRDLRREYASRVASDSPYQLNQWFSSAAWRKARSDVNELGADPAYAHLEVAYGLATYGDAAGIPNARLMDAACSKGD